MTATSTIKKNYQSSENVMVLPEPELESKALELKTNDVLELEDLKSAYREAIKYQKDLGKHQQRAIGFYSLNSVIAGLLAVNPFAFWTFVFTLFWMPFLAIIAMFIMYRTANSTYLPRHQLYVQARDNYLQKKLSNIPNRHFLLEWISTFTTMKIQNQTTLDIFTKMFERIPDHPLAKKMAKIHKGKKHGVDIILDENETYDLLVDVNEKIHQLDSMIDLKAKIKNFKEKNPDSEIYMPKSQTLVNFINSDDNQLLLPYESITLLYQEMQKMYDNTQAIGKKMLGL